MKDQNGNPVTRNVRKEADGRWGVNVWAGSSIARDLRRNYYATREEARKADISDDIGVLHVGRYVAGTDE